MGRGRETCQWPLCSRNPSRRARRGDDERARHVGEVGRERDGRARPTTSIASGPCLKRRPAARRESHSVSPLRVDADPTAQRSNDLCHPRTRRALQTVPPRAFRVHHGGSRTIARSLFTRPQPRTRRCAGRRGHKNGPFDSYPRALRALAKLGRRQGARGGEEGACLVGASEDGAISIPNFSAP